MHTRKNSQQFYISLRLQKVAIHNLCSRRSNIFSYSRRAGAKTELLSSINLPTAHGNDSDGLFHFPNSNNSVRGAIRGG